MHISHTETSSRCYRVTGPTHNLLELRFTHADSVKVTALPEDRPPHPKALNEETIRESVLSGVAEANEELGATAVVSEISYLNSDTPNADTYRILAYKITKARIEREPRTNA